MPASYDAPLLVTIDGLTPGRGAPSRTGRGVRDGDQPRRRDLDRHRRLRVHQCRRRMCGCPPPITTHGGAGRSGGDRPRGDRRRTDPRGQRRRRRARPGRGAAYSIRIPRDLLPVTTPGVYWFGVHALGASEGTPDDLVADGRARTFLPYVPRGRDGIGGKVDAAIVVPLRYRIRHLGNGQLARPVAWETAFEPTGELGGPLAFGSGSAGRPVTWLIDPAVLDAARRLRRGNPVRNLGPEETDAGEARTARGRRRDGGDESPTATEDPGRRARPRTTRPPSPRPTGSTPLEVQLRATRCSPCRTATSTCRPRPDRMPGLYPLSRERVGTVLPPGRRRPHR